MLTPEQRTKALIQAGEIFAWARWLPPEGWREVAATPGLGPAYRQAILHLADFCHQLSEPSTALPEPTP